MPGVDVDLVGDLHDLSGLPMAYDAIVCCSVLEHLEFPWVAADELATSPAAAG